MRSRIIALLILGFSLTLNGQTLHVSAQPDMADWDIIYVTDFDFENGQANPLIFGYRLYSEDNTYPMNDVSVSFRMVANVPSLGLENTTLIDAHIVLDLLAPIYITNRDLDVNIESRGMTDEAGNKIDFKNYTLETIDSDDANKLVNTVLRLGTMPAGNYSFVLDVSAPGYSVSYDGFNPNKQISIVTPANIDLIFPPLGYDFISDTYPVFEWNSTGCDDYYIRICEYNPLQQGSPEEAITGGEASLPFPDPTGDFFRVGSANRLDYATANGKPLEVGKAYAWQVKKVCTSNGADQEFYSEIYGFTISEAGQTLSPCQEQLKTVLGDSQFNVLFGRNGPLNGYSECSETILDNETINSTDFGALLVQLLSGAYNLESVTVQ